MPSPRHRIFGLSSVALVVAVSCAVFPDTATLPEHSTTAGTGGAPLVGGAAAGGMGVAGLVAGVSSTGGVPAEGGEPAVVGMGANVNAVGGAGGAEAGAGGAADGPVCSNPQRAVVVVKLDTWIESAKPSTNHGNDLLLSVMGGPDERRALLELDLPTAPVGAVLLQATLALHLSANADADLGARHLGLHRLDQPINESRATWDNYSNGASHKWTTPGGDFGPGIATAALRAGTTQGTLTFDITPAVRQAFATPAVPLSLILLEPTAAPSATAALAFTSSEGQASVPALVLDYCTP